MSRQKKLAVFNDLSGYGRCSLTVAIPILSAMGHQCCPVPTAVLSNHTEFPSFFYEDFTERIAPYIGEWRKLGLTFDGILTGFLGSAAQAEVVNDAVQRLKTAETCVIVDPVLGDDGSCYPTCGGALCEAMKTLAGTADVILPNLTEACLLTGTPYHDGKWCRKDLTDLAFRLRLLGARHVVITGVREGGYFTNVVLAQGAERAKFVRTKSAGAVRPGTGDVFAAVLAGAILRGTALPAAVREAAKFVKSCIRLSEEQGIARLNGVCFEWCLGELTR